MATASAAREPGNGGSCEEAELRGLGELRGVWRRRRGVRGEGGEGRGAPFSAMRQQQKEQHPRTEGSLPPPGPRLPGLRGGRRLGVPRSSPAGEAEVAGQRGPCGYL